MENGPKSAVSAKSPMMTAFPALSLAMP